MGARLGEIGHRLGRKILDEVATEARPDTILAWYRKLTLEHYHAERVIAREQQDVVLP